MAVESLLSLVAAAFAGAGSTSAVFLKSRSVREAKFYERYDRRMTELEDKVKECEAERPIIGIMRLGVCMMVPELQRLSRRVGETRNPVLDQVANAFKALPPTHSDLTELLQQLRAVDGVYTPAEREGGTNAA